MDDTLKETDKPADHTTVVFSIIAIGCAATQLTAAVLSLAVRVFAGPRAEFSDRLDNFIFDNGFFLDIGAIFFGLIGILFGGRSRRLGIVALVLVAAMFLLMFLV